jgi:asparagine synthase (glutamine-hydrolysing)
VGAQAGVWNFDGKPVDPGLITDLDVSLKPLGPDGKRHWSESSIALLYRPFHTTAESRRERQPYMSRKGFVLTWDGRIDNRDELAQEFRSCLGADPTDVALMAEAFDRWETGCFRRIVGDWAVSVWKPKERELYLGVDYMAIRHIFYYLNDDRIWWSTDLSPLVLLTGHKFHIDDDYISGYFAYDPEVHLTPYREVRQVPSGHFVRIRNGDAHIECYWSFDPTLYIRYKTDAEYEEHFQYVFRQSVRRRLRSDSPILAELSGGLDSSSIVCMADVIIKNERVQTPRLDTLSYYDTSEQSGDDWIYFRKVEAFRGRSGHHIDASKLVGSPATLEYCEFCPLPGELGAGRELETERARTIIDGGYRVVLSGIGGDEFLGGIPDPTSLLADLMVQVKLWTLAKQLVAWSLVKRIPLVELFWRSFATLFPPSIARHFVKETMPEAWIEPAFAKRTKLMRRLQGGNRTISSSLPTRRSCLEGLNAMAGKLAKLRPSILAPEELRYPYLDQNLMEFVLAIPATQLLRPGERRSLMRRALVGVVPAEILSRRTKQFAARTPLMVMLNKWDKLQRIFDRPLSSALGYINPAHFLAELKAAGNGQEIHVVRMLRTVSLEFWLRSLAARRLLDVDTSRARLCPPNSLEFYAQPELP